MVKLYLNKLNNACVITACAMVLLFSVRMEGAGTAEASKRQTDDSSQQPLLRLLRESRAPYDRFATRFIQHKRLAILDVTIESEGMIFFQRPGSIRYEILSPAKSVLTYDGKEVRCFAFSEGKWSQLKNPGATAIGQVLRQIGCWIQGNFDADQKMFEIVVEPSENGGGIINLIPRSKAMADYIQKIEIRVEKASDYRVTQVIIRESDVDVTEMIFQQELLNQSVPQGTFSSPDASDACRAIFPKEGDRDPNESKKAKS
jgi:outer membrane lipoprotein-sorting protein